MGYEDLNDHDELRHDPVMAVLAGKLVGGRANCAPVAGKSTLNRLELSLTAATRYHKIAHDPAAIASLFVTLFLEAHQTPPTEIVLDIDATDDPLHGHQEGRFFHGYYDCYCYLPLYVVCGRHLLAAKLRPANIDAAAGAVEEIARIVGQIRAQWPQTRIILRADFGLSRCEANAVDYIFGLAQNARLVGTIADELAEAQDESQQTGKPARRFKDFTWSTRKSWSRERRVIAKAEWTGGEANPRFIVTALTEREPPSLRESLLRPRRDGEPHQGMSDRPVRRPHLDRHHASQPAPSVVCLNGLCPGRGLRRLALRHPTSPTPPAAPSAASCSRSAPSSPSASAASSSPWHPAVRPLSSGELQPFVSTPPLAPAGRLSDTRRRTRHNCGIIPRPHRDHFFAAVAAPQNVPLFSRPPRHRYVRPMKIRENPPLGSAATPR